LIVYLHGFNSSPESKKAGQLRQAMAARGLADRFHAPALPHRPAQAMALVEAWLQARGPELVTFVGSSLGGYYATYLAERHDARAVLINPAVRPYHLLGVLLGPQENPYTGERYELTPEHMTELRALEVDPLHPQLYLLLAETGDELLDYRDAVERYRGARQIVLEGGDHSFSRFEDYIDAILQFSGLIPDAAP
jgi:predicted esterase YcpF (UPF0227 family)